SDGTIVVDDADAKIKPGERVLVVGESGTGKSTLVRAIAGLWPWGGGEIIIKSDAKLFLMPQRPYIPLGTLPRAATYPIAADAIDDKTLQETIDLVGLGTSTSGSTKRSPGIASCPAASNSGSPSCGSCCTSPISW